MKFASVLFLALFAGAAPALPAQAPASPPPILSAAGETLRRPQIVAFDGAVFDVAHDGGVAKVPWERMPEAWRRGYAYDPGAKDRTAAARAGATPTAPRLAEEPEVILAGRSLGLNKDGKLWIVLPVKLSVRMPDGQPPGEAELRRIPDQLVPQGSQIAVVPAAEVPPGWQKDQFIVVKGRLNRREPLERDSATVVNFVHTLTPWSDPQVRITPAPTETGK